MDNPLEQPAPEDPIARVHAFARDLAWGATHGMWGSGFGYNPRIVGKSWRTLTFENVTHQKNFTEYLNCKWDYDPPDSNLIRSFGFFELEGRGDFAYLLTPKAFALLEKPAIPPKIFISYRHAESSAFALLIEARLKNKDPDISVFIDKAIQKGEDWEERIKKAVETSGVFICLLGPDFAESDMMSMEIDWAEQSGSRLIAILHNNFNDEENCPANLKKKQWIKVQDESAEEYEVAVGKLLNALEYSTL